LNLTSLFSRKAGSDGFVGLFSEERPQRKVSFDAENEPTPVGSAELMQARSIPAIAIAGFCASSRALLGRSLRQEPRVD
jgi:hypothetical protein